VPGLLLGCLALILLVFAHIFTNVWGYIQPVSLIFRGKFWLAYFLPAGGISLLTWAVGNARLDSNQEPAGAYPGPGQSCSGPSAWARWQALCR